jgi:hypothetical protein
MLGMGYYIFGSARLHNPSLFHDDDIISHVRDNTKVVGNQHD